MTRPHEPVSGECSVEDCDLAARSRGLCDKHLTRFYKYGDVHHNERPQWGTDQITYGGAHLRTVRIRGAANLNLCTQCSSNPANDWAYDHEDPDEKTDPKTGLPYSTDPTHYVAMCIPCHKQFDKNWSTLVLRAN